jgi:hypothetical protein
MNKQLCFPAEPLGRERLSLPTCAGKAAQASDSYDLIGFEAAVSAPK